ncbi:MAG: hypothetical protein AB7U82_02195 [Blastocatellales bacterium]
MFFPRVWKRSARLPLAATLIAALVIAAVTTANATIMQYLEIEDLTRLSSDIFHGQVVSTNVYWNAERTHIYTAVRVRIGESFKGSTRRDQIVSVTQPGGERDGIRMDYAGRPEFAVGESVALFTVHGKKDDFIVVGLKQGKMRVERDQVVRDFSGIMLVDRVGRGKSLRPVNLKSTHLAMNEFRNRVARGR